VVITRTHTVKQTNIDPAFESAKAENCTLSILREQDGLSFLVKNSTTNQLYMIGCLPGSDLSVEPFQEVMSFFPQIPGKVVLASDFASSTLLPAPLMPKDLGWTKHLLGQKANKIFSSNKLECKAAAFLTSSEIKEQEIEHNWLLQLEKMSQSKGKKIWVDLGGRTANFYALEGKKIYLVNNLPIESKEDLLYHLGNITEQLKWNRETLHLEITGVAHSAYRAFVKPYFFNVEGIKVSKYVKVSSAMNEVDIASFGALLRI
jgi:hypothetical protein|tara:strand:- start:110 stop:892 length:783 start_codon:yes stop_codon:yes gene_type:complete